MITRISFSNHRATTDDKALGFPFQNCSLCDRNAGTSVELDAEWQFQVTITMSAAGMVPVGWYHSHPIFEPRPSAKDNENQRNYQALCRLEPSGLEPWVGAIVSPYDQALPTSQSGLQFWVVRQRERSLTPYHVRVSKLPITKVPEAGDNLEKQIVW